MTALFQRARAYAAFTPAERAILKLLEGLACAALVAALPIVASALARGSIIWPDVGRAALAAAVAILLALAKYARAHGDPALGATLASVAADLPQPTGALAPASAPGAPVPAPTPSL